MPGDQYSFKMHSMGHRNQDYQFMKASDEELENYLSNNIDNEFMSDSPRTHAVTSYGGRSHTEDILKVSSSKSKSIKCEGCRQPVDESDLIIRNRGTLLAYTVKGTKQTFLFHNESCVV